MTIKKEKNENEDDSGKNESPEKIKSNKISEKLKAMGVMPSDKKTPESKERKYSPLLITLLIATPVVGGILYYNMPDEINALFASATDSISTSEAVDQSSLNAADIQPQANDYSAAGHVNGGQLVAWNQARQPEWVSQRRAEMEKYRLELQKQNPYSYSSSSQPMTPPEPPQWVKDRQAQMEQEMARHQQQWSDSSANWTNNRMPDRPGYMRHPAMNPYQANSANTNNTMQPQQYPAPVNRYQQPQMQPQMQQHVPPPMQANGPGYYQQNPNFYNGPNNGYGPYYPPYRGYANPYR